MSKMMHFKEAYEEYKKGKFIRSPNDYKFNSLQNNRLHLIHVDMLEKFWEVKDPHESTIKVNKYRVLYKFDNEIILSDSYYIDKDDFEEYGIDEYNSWKYEFIKLVEETEKEFETTV